MCFVKSTLYFSQRCITWIESRNHSRFWWIYRKALESTHTHFSLQQSQPRYTLPVWVKIATSGSVVRQTNTRPPSHNLISPEDGSSLARSIYSVCVCVCEIVLSGQRGRLLQVQSEDLTEAQKKKIKPTFSPQHDYSTIPNKHRKMRNHNFYCSVIRRQFKGNIATYILGELSQGLQNYFQYLKEKRKMLITQKLDHPEWEDGCKCSQAKCWKNKRWKTQQKVSLCVTTAWRV